MKSRILTIGFIAGLLMSVAAIYPVVSLIAPLAIPTLIRPIENELWHGIALMVSAALAIFIMFDFGWLAAREVDTGCWQDGAKAGAIAGVVVGCVTFVTILSPLYGLFAYTELAGFQPTPEIVHPSRDVLEAYIGNMLNGPTLGLFYGVVINAVFGASTGALFAWRHRDEDSREEPPSLSSHLAHGRHPSTWFVEDKQAVIIALGVGLVIGILNAFYRIEFLTSINAYSSNFTAAVDQLWSGSTWQQLFAPFTIILFSYGAAVVYLLKNPNDRWRARIRACILAGYVSLVPVLALSLRYVYLIVGLTPYMAYRTLQNSPAGSNFSQLQALITDEMFKAQMMGAAFFALPWVLVFVAIVSVYIISLLQGVVYAGLVPMFAPRPVDIAYKYGRKIRKEPDQVIPILYSLFGKYPQVYSILAHLTVFHYRDEPDISQLTAYFHTLGTNENSEEHAKALAGIRQIIGKNGHWRWSSDFGAIYKALHDVMSAHTLEQMLAVPTVAEQTTASLPASIVRQVQLINNILEELKKVERTDDYQTKTIFLENTLKAINKAQKTINNYTIDEERASSPPERLAITTTLEHWQETILEVLHRMKGRAVIDSTLRNDTCPISARVPLVYEIRNEGLNVAQKVQLRLMDSPDFHLQDDGRSDIFIDILAPGEQREESIIIVPHNGNRRLRIQWEVTYDDAIDAQRQLEFADMLEFTDPDKPFQRVFPIPYVTGTPLKSDDVFVGREDVFEFIQENLLGTHQNNAIILHGQRRTGKTSVLYRLGHVMAGTHIGVLIDMQGKPARSESDFLYSIADDIAFELEEHDIFVDPPVRADFEDAPEFFFRSRFLRGLKKELGEKKLLLLFDEFEELQQRVEDGRLSPEIFQFLRNLMQHEEHIDFVFSGTHKLEELGAEYWSILFNIAVYKPITFLSEAETRRLIQEPVREFNVEYDPLAIKRIAHVTAGHPYFTQLVLHEMIIYHNETERNYLTVAHVNQVLERIVERGEAHFKYIWAESTPEERTILRAVTELLIGKDAIHIKDLHAYLDERGEAWTDAHEKGFYSVLSRDILMRRNPRSPLYRFKIDLIRLWIERTQKAIV